MYRLLRMLILLKAIPVSNNSFYTFKLWSVPTLMSCMIWFLPPTLFFAIAEWRAEIELSTVQEFKSEIADLNRYVPVPVWQIQNIFMEMQIRIWIHFSIWCISRCCSRSGCEKKIELEREHFFSSKSATIFPKSHKSCHGYVSQKKWQKAQILVMTKEEGRGVGSEYLDLDPDPDLWKIL